jgi:hypothetical protein
MKRLIGTALMVMLMAAACGSKGPVKVRAVGTSPTPGVRPTTPATSGPSPTPGETTPPAPAGTLTVQVWFTEGEHLFQGFRTQQATVAVGKAALTQLLAGPSAAERAAGVQTSVPASTDLLGLSIQDGVATVDLGGAFDDGGGSLSERMRLAQVVYTITQFPTVQGVSFQLDGKAVTTFSGQGIVLDRPQTRQDFEDVLPAIVVDAPRVGQNLSSPASISGTANVFEATVSFQVLDQNGNVVGEGFTTASCGTGCRGDFVATAEYEVDHDQPGTIRVFESSAKDGSAINLVEIPVELRA